MSSLNPWQAKIAALMALAITAGATASIINPVFAQSAAPPAPPAPPSLPNGGPNGSPSYPGGNQTYPNGSPSYQNGDQQDQVSIPSGTRIPVRYDKAKKIVVAPDETTSLTLKVASDITNRNGTVLIPAGTQVVGQLEPAGRDTDSESRDSEKGTRFVAKELKFNSNRRHDIDATSQVITRTERVSKGASTGTLLTGAAAGAGAAALIAGVTGDKHIQALDVLGGAGVGTIGGALLGRKNADVIVVYPSRGDLDLTLRSDLAVGY